MTCPTWSTPPSAGVKKTKLRPHLKQCPAIPARANGEFLARMEDVLDVYARPVDPARPGGCLAEKPYQLPRPRPRPDRRPHRDATAGKTPSTSGTAPVRS